jgi:O-antigen/teichoic acid export membrane protein
MSLSLFLIVNYAFGWEGRVYGQIVSELLISIVALFILTNRKYIKMKLKYEYIVDSLKYGLPLIPHVLSTSIISMTDRLFISQAEGLAVTGIYTVGYQIGSVMNLITMSFNNAFVPWLFQKLKDDNYDAKKRIVKFTYYYFFLLIGAAIFLGVAAPSVLNFIVSDSYSGSSIYVIWIALGYAFNGMYLMVVNYIFYAERNGLLSIVTFSTAILNVILNYFFVGWYGAIGAAQATSIIFGVKMIMVWILSARVYKMPWLMNRERRYN